MPVNIMVLRRRWFEVLDSNSDSSVICSNKFIHFFVHLENCVLHSFCLCEHCSHSSSNSSYNICV